MPIYAKLCLRAVEYNTLHLVTQQLPLFGLSNQFDLIQSNRALAMGLVYDGVFTVLPLSPCVTGRFVCFYEGSYGFFSVRSDSYHEALDKAQEFINDALRVDLESVF